ncbi:uncharacterized protein LOC142566695 [Dermacentor variabilis]|uniref:uncharacterized protein LOC142566695 n=1 Tax=Dermacentor variabilis TaxID=34621 RepID=UPI003F5B3954
MGLQDSCCVGRQEFEANCFQLLHIAMCRFNSSSHRRNLVTENRLSCFATTQLLGTSPSSTDSKILRELFFQRLPNQVATVLPPSHIMHLQAKVMTTTMWKWTTALHYLMRRVL